MKNWFETLDSRERIFVLGGAVVVAIALLYAFVWTPLDKGHKSRQSSVLVWQRALEELRPLAGLQQAPAGAIQPTLDTSGRTPVVIVDQTLRARGLDRSLQRSQPTTSNGIRVEFENVSFDDLMMWLEDLSSQYAMHVASGSMSVPSQADPGRINATLTLERGL